MARAAGADITEADRRWEALIPNEIYAPRTLPAMVAKPPVMTAWSSDRVILGRYGRIRRGASDCKVFKKRKKRNYKFWNISQYWQNSDLKLLLGDLSNHGQDWVKSKFSRKLESKILLVYGDEALMKNCNFFNFRGLEVKCVSSQKCSSGWCFYPVLLALINWEYVYSPWTGCQSIAG